MYRDSYVQLKYAVVFFKVQELVSGTYITDQQEAGFKFYYVWAEGRISMLSRYFRFKMASFSYHKAVVFSIGDPYFHV